MYNHFNASEFQIFIHKLPKVSFAATKFDLPGISGSAPQSPTPFNPINMAYDKIEYSPLTLDFIVDENLDNYISVFNWMKGLGTDEKFKQRVDLKNQLVTDVTVVMYSSSDNPVKTVEFKNCMPTALSNIQLSTNEQDVVYPHANLSMTYDYYNFV